MRFRPCDRPVMDTTPDIPKPPAMLAANYALRRRAGRPPLTVLPGGAKPGADFNTAAVYVADPPPGSQVGRNDNRSAVRTLRAGRPAEMGVLAPVADGDRCAGSPTTAREAAFPTPRTAGPGRPGRVSVAGGAAAPQDGPSMPVHPLRRPVTADRPTDVGAVTHAVIGHLAHDARTLTEFEVADRVIAAAGQMVVNKVASRRRAVWFEAVGHASLYLRCLVPPLPWALLGVEHGAGAGLVDLAWEHPLAGVVYEEIKTTGHGGVTDPGPAYIEQCLGYAQAGAAEHGDRFLGVRLVVLGGLRASRLVHADGRSLPLSGRDPAGRLHLDAATGTGQ